MKFPLQPIGKDEHGVLRFTENSIVSFLLNSHPTVDMNELAVMSFTREEREQFAQLIGYSLSGFGELGYVKDTTYQIAERLVVSLEDKTQEQLRIEELEAQLKEVRNKLKALVPVVFHIHPDDLVE